MGMTPHNTKIEVCQIADALGIVFNGVQEDINGDPAARLYTDPVTGGTFAVRNEDPHEVAARLGDLRRKFAGSSR